MYPKLGETHMRLALDRELMYASDFPFIDYGIDLKVMAEMEKGIKMVKIKRSDIDADPPEAIKKKIEAGLMKLRSKKKDYLPETFIGKAGDGYILKNMIVHRGLGAPKTSKAFRDAIRLTGTKNEHLLKRNVLERMKVGGPRYAAMKAKK